MPPITIEAAFRGDPIAADHQPDPVEIVEALEPLQALLDASTDDDAIEDAISDSDLPHFMLATGQSNMLVGMNSDTRAGAKVIRNRNVWVWSTPAQAWLRTAPGEPDWPYLALGNNLAYVAACARQKRIGGIVLLLIVAAGGQPIEQWIPGLASTTPPYQSMFGILNGYLELARDAPLPFRTDGATLRTLEKTYADELLWHQGESNADYIAIPAGFSTGATYKARVLQVFELMRDPQAGGSSAAQMLRTEGPVAMGELLRGGQGSQGDPIDDRNAEIRQICRENELISLVSSENLKSGDNIHFWGEDLVTFGLRYADVLENIPKYVPNEIGLDHVVIAGRLRKLSISAVTVPANDTLAVDLNAIFGITMGSSGYAPTITPISVAGTQVYADPASFTTTGFTLVNPNTTNGGVVKISIVDLVAG